MCLNSPRVARAMVFSEAPPQPNCRPACVLAEGVIDAKTVRLFAQFVRRDHIRSGATVALDSLGGLHLLGIGLGEAIRQYGFATEVGRFDPEAQRLGPGTCASACVYAFMGGTARAVVPGSRVGVHEVSIGREAPDQPANKAQLLMALAGDHLAQWGATGDVLNLALATPSDEIRWLSPEEMARFRVTTTGTAPIATGPQEGRLPLEAVIRFRLLGVHVPESEPPPSDSSRGPP